MVISFSKTAAVFFCSLVSMNTPNEPESQEEEAGNQSIVPLLLAALS